MPPWKFNFPSTDERSVEAFERQIGEHARRVGGFLEAGIAHQRHEALAGGLVDADGKEGLCSGIEIADDILFIDDNHRRRQAVEVRFAEASV